MFFTTRASVRFTARSVHLHDTPVAADERRQGDGLRGGERDAASGTVMNAAVMILAPEMPPRSIRHPAFEDRLHISGSTGPDRPSASAPLPAQALASRCSESSCA